MTVSTTASPATANAPRPGAARRTVGWAVSLLAGLALAACGGGGGSTTTTNSATQEPTAANQATIATAQSGEVLGYVKSKLQARGPQGGYFGSLVDFSFGGPGGPGGLTGTTTGGTVPTASDTVAKSGTLVQEAGVDEDDLIKTDGNRIYTLQRLQPTGEAGSGFARLAIYTRDAAGKTQAAGSTTLSANNSSWVQTRGMLLASDLPRVAVVAEGPGDLVVVPVCPPDMACTTSMPVDWATPPRVHVQLLDVSQPAQLPAPERLVIDGRLIGTRLIGRTLYLVATHAPQFAFDLLPATATETEKRTSLDGLAVSDVLPHITINGGPRVPLVTENDCWLQPANASTQVALTTITTIDLGSPTWTRSSRCFVGGTEALYMAPGNVYLATTRNDIQTLQGRLSFAPEMRTDIHKFAVNGSNIDYRGSGSVNGSLGWDREKTPYRLSEHNGDLRVLSFTGSFGWVSAADAATIAASPATLTVLRENTAERSLRTLATLPNPQRPAAIGKAGEQVYAVRFLGDKAYVVTFRQTDPLYVLDLSNPADPRSAGELQVPGFSDWLYPLDGGLLFGVGKDATEQGRLQGVKVALFDVRDAANPKLLDSRNFGARGSITALDFSAHGLSLAVVGNTTRLALPMLLVTEAGSPTQRLQRFEVDSAARSLLVKPPIEFGTGWADLSGSRSLQLGNQLHHLRDGQLETWDW